MKKLTLILAVMLHVTCSSDSSKLEDYVGLDIKSNQMQGFLKNFGEPEISIHEAQPAIPLKTIEIGGKIDTVSMAIEGQPASKYYLFKDKGLQIKLYDRDIVEAFFLFGEGKDGYRQYQGELPLGLKFTDTRKTIIEKIGKPESSFSGSPQFNFQCFDTYGKSRFSITYNTTDSTNMLATIAQICVSKP